MSGFLRVSCGVEIPNAFDMAVKRDGAGATGPPTGWSSSSLGTVGVFWDPLAALDTEGRSLRLSVPSGIGAGTRYVQSPVSRAGQLYGSESIGWPVRLRWMFSGSCSGSPAGDDVYVAFYYDNAAGTDPQVIDHYYMQASDWNAGWIVQQSPLTAISAGHTPDVIFARVFANNNSAGATISASFAHFSVETIRPADASAGNGYYELSSPWRSGETTPPRMQGFRVQSRFPSGRARNVDPTGGVKKRLFTFETPFLTPTDREIIWRLWMTNGGYGTDSGTKYGQGAPLILMPNTPDTCAGPTGRVYPMAYYVDFDGPACPVDRYYGKWQAATAAGTRFGATLKFRER